MTFVVLTESVEAVTIVPSHVGVDEDGGQGCRMRLQGSRRQQAFLHEAAGLPHRHQPVPLRGAASWAAGLRQSTRQTETLRFETNLAKHSVTEVTDSGCEIYLRRKATCEKMGVTDATQLDHVIT